MITQKIKEYMPQFVYGGMDGIVTTFAVVAGAAGANLSLNTIIVFGFANLIADGFSMSVGSFLSKQTELDMEDKTSFKLPFYNALATFISFNVVGLVPLLFFILPISSGMSSTQKFLTSTILTLVSFVTIGYFKSHVSKKSVLGGILETVLLGSVAAVLAYFAGSVVERLVG